MQLTHSNSIFSTKNNSIILVCDTVNSPANIGSIFRIADAFGIEKVIFGNFEVDINSNRLKRTARSTQNWVNMEDQVDLLPYLLSLKKDDYEIIALEITDNSNPIHKFSFSKHKKIVLVVGEESGGVSTQILEQCNHHVHIQMFGKNSSMNVAQATTVALYEITKQIN